MKRQTLKQIYYFCTEEELSFRLSNAIHTALVSGQLTVPEYANHRRRVLEVHLEPSQSLTILDVRGLYYAFDEKGRLDLHTASEAAVLSIEGDKPEKIQEHVVDIGPVVRARRWQVEQKWIPGPQLLAALKREIEGPAESKKIPTWRPSKAM